MVKILLRSDIFAVMCYNNIYTKLVSNVEQSKWKWKAKLKIIKNVCLTFLSVVISPPQILINSDIS